MKINFKNIFSILCLSFGLVKPHISLDPNYGVASGSYFLSDIKIPHGKTNLETSKIDIQIPNGVLSVKPLKITGWNINIKYRNISTYYSHGKPINTAPDYITYSSSASQYNLHNDHLLILSLQLKIGCNFSSNKNTNSIWENEYTLWFPTTQYFSSSNSLIILSNINWTSIPNIYESWGSYINPSPYLFMYSSSSCPNGMYWDNKLVPISLNKSSIKNIEHVKSLINEQLLNFLENLNYTNIDNSYTTSNQNIGIYLISILSLIQINIYLFIKFYNYLSLKSKKKINLTKISDISKYSSDI